MHLESAETTRVPKVEIAHNLFEVPKVRLGGHWEIHLR